jgi:hypothetical protein
MPGVNTTGKPQTTDIRLGRGAIHFASLDPVTRKPLGFRHLGNCIALTLNVESETLEHFSSRTGVRSVDKEIILSQKVGVSLTLDENNFQNWALFLSGTATKGVANPAATTVAGRLITADAFKGFSYQLENASGNRLFDLSANGVGAALLTVRTGGSAWGTGTTNLLEGTDYEVDRKWGTIFLLSTGSTHVDGANLWFEYTTSGTSQEKVVDQVDILTQTSISGFLRYVGINAANNDKQECIDLHSVTLKADGELPLISDEYTSMTLVGSAERNETGYPTSPVGRIFTHADA